MAAAGHSSRTQRARSCPNKCAGKPNTPVHLKAPRGEPSQVSSAATSKARPTTPTRTHTHKPSGSCNSQSAGRAPAGKAADTDPDTPRRGTEATTTPRIREKPHHWQAYGHTRLHACMGRMWAPGTKNAFSSVYIESCFLSCSLRLGMAVSIQPSNQRRQLKNEF